MALEQAGSPEAKAFNQSVIQSQSQGSSPITGSSPTLANAEGGSSITSTSPTLANAQAAAAQPALVDPNTFGANLVAPLGEATGPDIFGNGFTATGQQELTTQLQLPGSGLLKQGANSAYKWTIL